MAVIPVRLLKEKPSIDFIEMTTVCDVLLE